MPRIRNWQHLTLYRPDKDERYDHIDTLYPDTIDWGLIATHLPDMLRVALSIKTRSCHRPSCGDSARTRARTSFRELERVVRTAFHLQYLGDGDLRATIQAATTKSEAFNRFAKWAMFGSEGIITENDRAAQRKAIRYNHLVANCIIF
jgi:TnpA family transposase